MNRKNKIQVTVVTGFLGAGKTTFINRLLQKYCDTKFALVENEFGDVAIDTKLIKGVDASQMFELKQGCICCTISDEFELVLQELAQRFPDVEHLLIETTGVADPAQVIQPFFRDDNLKKIYRYNGTVCIVDALHYEFQPEEEIVLKQLVVADLLQISKSENLSENEKNNLEKGLRKINPYTEIIFGFVDGFQLNILQKRVHSPFGSVGLQYNIHSNHSNKNIQSKTLFFDEPIDKGEFARWLSYTLDVYKKQIYRVKGILSFTNEPYLHILQGVGGSFEIAEGDLIWGGAKSKVVFIGKLEGASLDFQSGR